MKGHDTSGDIGLFEEASEEEASLSDEEGTSDAQSARSGDDASSDAISEDEDDSEWTPGAETEHESRNGGPASKGRDCRPESFPEPATVKNTRRIFEERALSPVSPLQEKIVLKEEVISEANSFDELLDRSEGDDSIVIIPNKQARKAAMKYASSDAQYIPHPGEVESVPKKKKRLEQCFL